jgi:DtxR family Mn-dependent transcriptional regulator
LYQGGEFRTFRGYSLSDEAQGLTPSMEDYIEMIYRLTLDRKYVRLTDVAASLNVQPPSATKMVQRLAEGAYVNYEKHGVVELTDLGKEIGASLLHRHHVIETFLRLFGVRDNILKDTERIEHIISDELVSRIISFNEFAKENPTWIAEFLSKCPPDPSD